MKDPSGGTTGRVKPYGRLGWMGARAGYSHGEGFPLPHELVARGVPGVQSRGRFFLTSWEAPSACENLSAAGRFLRRNGGDLRLQRVNRRDLALFWRVFSGLFRCRC